MLLDRSAYHRRRGEVSSRARLPTERESRELCAKGRLSFARYSHRSSPLLSPGRPAPGGGASAELWARKHVTSILNTLIYTQRDYLIWTTMAQSGGDCFPRGIKIRRSCRERRNDRVLSTIQHILYWKNKYGVDLEMIRDAVCLAKIFCLQTFIIFRIFSNFISICRKKYGLLKLIIKFLKLIVERSG